MPKYDIGPTIGIQGEREYQDALKAIEQGQKTMASEMQKVAAQFAGNEKSIEALTAKHDVLTRTLYGEREKVEKLREAVKHATEAYGEGDKRTQSYQAQLYKAEAGEYRLEKQLVDTSKELKKQGVELETDEKALADFGKQTEETAEKSSALGGILDALASKFGINLPSGITNSLQSLGGFSAGSLAAVTAVGSLVTALVKVEQKFMDLAKEQASAADELATLSVKTGISTQALQEYAYAAELMDVSVETITGAQTRLIRSMDSARDGAAQQTAAFEKLGIQYQNTDGTLRNSETVFWDVIDALGRISNDTERDAAAMDLLGKSAQDLNPLIKAGSDQMRAYAKEAENVGYILGEKDLKALTTLDDAQQRLQKSNEALEKQIAAQFAPSATKAIEGLTKLTQVFGQAVTDSGIVQAFGFLLETVTGIVAPMGSMEDAAYKLTRAMRPLSMMLATAADAANVIIGLGKMVGGTLSGVGIFNGTVKEGWNQFSQGVGYDSARSRLESELAAADARREAERTGDPTYYNGQFYGSADAALYARFEDALAQGFSGTFEYWKLQNGHNAAGTDYWRGGLTWVGEAGPELADLPRGTQIYTAQESRDIAEGVTNIYVTIPASDIRQFEDIVDIAMSARTDARRGKGARR